MPDLPTVDLRDHFWIVAGDATRLWSSARRAYVPANDPAWMARVAAGGRAARIASEAELWEVLARQAPDLLPAIAEAQEVLKEGVARDLNGGALFKVAFNLNNRVLVLEGKPTLTPAQFRAVLKNLL